MARALERYPDVEITWLFSGRDRDQLFGVADNFLWRRGMTFVSENGKVDYVKTLLASHPLQFIRDVRQLNVSGFDQVVVDFEPVTAWAARLAGKQTLGIGHQYAFNFPVPVAGDNPVSRRVLRNFAPAEQSLGLHWHHFDYPILPPIVDLDPGYGRNRVENKVVVYLAFENQDKVIRLLRSIESHEFYIYAPGLPREDTCNIHTRPTSRNEFKRDLLEADAVICNTGFELISECLTLGIRVLTRPLDHQMEQLSNARALETLEYARVMYELSARTIEAWLSESRTVRISYPDVHEAIAAWLVRDQQTCIEVLAGSLWEKVCITRS